MLLRKLSSGGAWDDSGADDDSGYDDSGADDDSGYDDSGARGNRAPRGNNNRQGILANRGGGGGRRNAPSPQQMLAREVENNQVAAAAKLQVFKKKYTLFRTIPLIAPQSVGIAGTANINVTPTSKAWCEQLTAFGGFTITSLVMGGQTLVPNGSVDSKMFENVSQYNRPLNIPLDTVPITGAILNSTGVAAICSFSAMVWMEDTAKSERF